jgi:DNA-binding protein HU-beta
LWISSAKASFNFSAMKKRLNLSLFTRQNHYMNKADLISKIADETGITKAQANAAIDVLTESITKALKGGGKVTLVGFGTFSVSKRSARNGRNPKTGDPIRIKAKKVARFKAGKELAERI